MLDIKPEFVPPLDNTPVYNMIRQFGRKNWNVVKRYIEIYSNDGDIIYDPFGGSGVVAFEGLKLNRKVIYNDLNPFQCFVAKNICTPVNLDNLKKAYKDLLKALNTKEFLFEIGNSSEKMKYKLNWFLTTNCSCGNKGIIQIIYYDDLLIYNTKIKKDPIDPKELNKSHRHKVLKEIKKNKSILKEDLTNILKSKIPHFNKFPYTIEARLKYLSKKGLIKRKKFVPLRIKYKCSCNKRKKIKDLDDNDKEKIEKIQRIIPSFYFPKGKLEYRNGKRFITRRSVHSVANLFTKRNLIILSVIRNEIINLNYSKEVIDSLLLCFASILFDTSIMKREGAGSWGAKEYWIPTTIVELNPIERFKQRFEITQSFGKEKGIIIGKEETTTALVGKFKAGKRFRDLQNDFNVLFFKKDARDLYFDGKIDYIFTDPSYGEAIQYGELTYMAMNWLDMKMDFEKEIIVNKNQGKDQKVYANMLLEAFEKIYISLKPRGYLTVTFHSREANIWNSLLYAINCNNFEYVDAIYQPKPKEHSNFIYKQKPGAMQGDIYITFKKNENLKRTMEEISLEQIIEDHIIPEAKKLILSRRGKSVTYDQLVRAITLRLIRKNLLHRKEIVDIDYSKLFDKYFIREEAETKAKKIKTKAKKKDGYLKIKAIDKFT